MNLSKVVVGIAYNTYKEVPRYQNQVLSEETIAGTARQVSTAVTSLGHSVVVLPLRGSILNVLQRIKELKLDVLVNLCEGFNGFPQLESNVAGAFELLGIPFTGNTSQTLALCQDKYKAKAVLSSYGLPTASCTLVTSLDQVPNVKFPVIVKPNCEDASLGIGLDAVVFDREGLVSRINRIVQQYEQPALVEKYIEGREFNVAVMEKDKPEALPVSEIDFTGMPDEVPKIICYEAKWFEDHELFLSTPPVCPARIEDSLRKRIQKIAVRAFEAMGCRDYARVDIRMDNNGNIFILEVNPNPDISLNAGYVRALRAAGIEYPSFWESMISNALRRILSRDKADEKVG